MFRFGRFDPKRGKDDPRTALDRCLTGAVFGQVLCPDNVYRPKPLRGSSGITRPANRTYAVRVSRPAEWSDAWLAEWQARLDAKSAELSDRIQDGERRTAA